VQPDGLHEPQHVRLGAAEPQGLAAGAQALGQAREVDHQRQVGEAQLGEVDDDVGRGAQGRRERPPAEPAGGTVLVALDAQQRELFVERDDVRQRTGRVGSRTPRRCANAPVARRGRPTMGSMIDEDDVLEALANVIDPELGLDFVELGLVYGVEIDGGTVKVTFTLTTPACPIGPQVSEQMEEFVSELPGVTEVIPNMVFTPPWTPEKMSEDAKFALGY
jgi:metal-sulfur cluster biosynthetic enzyme